MALFRCGSGNNNSSNMPLIVSASGSSSPSVTVVKKNQQYLIAPSGDSQYVLFNDYKGYCTMKAWDYAPALPTLIKKDGTKSSVPTSPFKTDDYVAARSFTSSGHQYGYYITFS